ncbi:type II 3-dehydroquinate dehydratase [Billgrantia lactosivorans]|uniref:type II 3-dehydroquinate dehydratase n=1 Tax=Billgrantia lactosivorans TaxID=2185141 RepID=UPI000DAB4C2B|nr:type II 3-dehydroquinate dehydratase [Halomonas lactosivorans]
MTATLLVLNGPNLNMLGTRQPDLYGHETLADVESICLRRGEVYGLAIDFRQTNHEGELIGWLHQARGKVAGVVLNPAAWTHTSVAIRDAILASELPVIEVHISNVHQREAFRHRSYVSDVAVGVICGLGTHGYALAIDGFAQRLGGGAR